MSESSPSSNLLPDSERDSKRDLQFSSTLTAFCLLVCVMGLALLVWSVSFSEVFPESKTVSRDLERIASRMLDFETRLSELSAFEQAMFRLWGEDGDIQEQFRLWYAELPKDERNPLDKLYAGILDGEADLKKHLVESMENWSSASPPLPTFRRLLAMAYLEGDQGDTDFHILQARLAEEVPANWFYFQLAKRLASQSGEKALRENLHRQFQGLTNSQLLKGRGLVIFEFSMVGMGLMCLVYVVVMWVNHRTVQRDAMFNQWVSPWSFHEGLAVLARGGAVSILFIVLLAAAPYGLTILEDYGSLVLYLPTVALAMVLLCQPRNQSLFEVLGGKNLLQRLWSSLPILLSVMALGLIGEWLIMLGGDVFEISVHWTEWFLPQLVWGSQAELVKTTVEVVLLAPIFEEIIFRGIVFTTLRAKFGFPVSMIGSAVIFALAHGYGPVAFLTVFWSGLLWAWIYERTGSVIPGMCAHAVNNGLVVYVLVALFR